MTLKVPRCPPHDFCNAPIATDWASKDMKKRKLTNRTAMWFMCIDLHNVVNVYYVSWVLFRLREKFYSSHFTSTHRASFNIDITPRLCIMYKFKVHNVGLYLRLWTTSRTANTLHTVTYNLDISDSDSDSDMSVKVLYLPSNTRTYDRLILRSRYNRGDPHTCLGVRGIEVAKNAIQIFKKTFGQKLTK